MKKILLALIISLTFSFNVLASNMLTQLADIFTNNIYCPATIAIQNNTVYGATSIFTRGEYSSAESLQNKKKKLYFALASEESGTAVCIYDSKNLQVTEWLYANKHLKANRDALHNNWSQDATESNSLSCLYNARHCPFMNY